MTTTNTIKRKPNQRPTKGREPKARFTVRLTKKGSEEVAFDLMIRRLAMDLSVSQLAAKAFVSESTIRAYESGRTFLPSLRTLVKLGRPLKFDLVLESK